MSAIPYTTHRCEFCETEEDTSLPGPRWVFDVRFSFIDSDFQSGRNEYCENSFSEIVDQMRIEISSDDIYRLTFTRQDSGDFYLNIEYVSPDTSYQTTKRVTIHKYHMAQILNIIHDRHKLDGIQSIRILRQDLRDARMWQSGPGGMYAWAHLPRPNRFNNILKTLCD